MDIRKVKKLIEMLEQSGVSEIEIHEGEESVRISRQSSIAPPVQTVVQIPAVATEQAATDTGQVNSESEGHVIKAPMVGIFYAGPSPDKPAFVERGQNVMKGDVLCIIEAMKIMNQIETDFSGVIGKVMVENGEPVEYGQPLFSIREA
ncbi:MAG: acetyl-CoA carboxylase biotin carboxyl carrier protein [Proteobacteria bacterium]|nr:acetyl-CoA carboxylase biotin carboxyl carrier protein [Pseudomonadota bacterium]